MSTGSGFKSVHFQFSSSPCTASSFVLAVVSFMVGLLCVFHLSLCMRVGSLSALGTPKLNFRQFMGRSGCLARLLCRRRCVSTEQRIHSLWVSLSQRLLTKLRRLQLRTAFILVGQICKEIKRRRQGALPFEKEE